MADAIYIVADDGGLAAAPRTPYALEDDLQKLIADHPQLLPGDQINPEQPRRWRLIKREAGIGSATATSRWSLDHLFVDQDAVPTLVEAKKGGNPEARREVVAQLLEYAANGTLYWPMDQLRSWFEAGSGGRQAAIQSIADLTLGDASEEAFEEFWILFEANLRERRIRLIFVADDIPSELKTLVEFLNEQMEKVEVLAVEVVQYASDGRRLLKPQLIGQTAQTLAKQRTRVTPPRRDHPWSMSELVDLLSDYSQAAGAYGARVAEWAGQNVSFRQEGNRGLTYPTVALRLTVPGRGPVTILSVGGSETGILEIPFGTIRQLDPFTDTERRRKLHEDLKRHTRMAKDDPDMEVYAYAGINEIHTIHELDSLLAILGSAVEAIEQAIPQAISQDSRPLSDRVR